MQNSNEKVLDQVYENGTWSKYLDMSLPKLFNSTFKIEKYIDKVDLSNEQCTNELKKNQEKF